MAAASIAGAQHAIRERKVTLNLARGAVVGSGGIAAMWPQAVHAAWCQQALNAGAPRHCLPAFHSDTNPTSMLISASDDQPPLRMYKNTVSSSQRFQHAPLVRTAAPRALACCHPTILLPSILQQPIQNTSLRFRSLALYAASTSVSLRPHCAADNWTAMQQPRTRQAALVHGVPVAATEPGSASATYRRGGER